MSEEMGNSCTASSSSHTEPYRIGQYTEHTNFTQGLSWSNKNLVSVAWKDSTCGVAVRDHDGKFLKNLGNLSGGGNHQVSKFSRDEKFFVTGDAKNGLTIFNADTWEEYAVIPDIHTYHVQKADFSPDSQEVASISSEVCVTNIETKTVRFKISKRGLNVMFSPNGKVLAVTGSPLSFHDVANSGELLYDCDSKFLGSELYTLDWFADSRRIVFPAKDSLIIYDTIARQDLRRITIDVKAGYSSVISLQLSPCQSLIATGGGDKHIHIINVNSGQDLLLSKSNKHSGDEGKSEEIACLDGKHNSSIYAVCWSPKRLHRIASCGDDHLVNVWQLPPYGFERRKIVFLIRELSTGSMRDAFEIWNVCAVTAKMIPPF